MGSQSLVGDKPVFAAAQFPFLKAFEDNWQAIQAELDEVLRGPRQPAGVPRDLAGPEEDLARRPLEDLHFLGLRHAVRGQLQALPADRAPARHTVPGLQTAWFSNPWRRDITSARIAA